MAASASSVPYNEAGPREARHFPILGAMKGPRAPSAIGPDLPYRPCSDIMSGISTAAEDCDTTHAVIGEEPLDGDVHAGRITDQDRPLLIDEHPEPRHYADR